MGCSLSISCNNSRTDILLAKSSDLQQVYSLVCAEKEAIELLKQDLRKSILKDPRIDVEGMDSELMDILILVYSTSESDRESIIPRITALLLVCDPGYRAGVISVIASFVTLLRKVLPSPNDPLNGILCALDKLVVEFPKDSVKPVMKGSLFVSDISKVLQIKDPMGKGGQATVFSAVLRSTGMRVAVKVESKQMDSKAKLYFERETGLLNKLKGIKHVAQMLYMLDDASNHYIVQELITGPSLINVLAEKKKPIDEETSKIILRTLIETVIILHQKDIIHRDIKPDNIMLADSDDLTNIILIDFGYSREVDEKNMSTGVGTRVYRAPEIMANSHYDQSADVWSIGATAYAM
ncbi:hypothetical protein BLSTO_05056 [Blastocystis sp. subtype 1]